MLLFLHVRVALKSRGISQHSNEVGKLKFDCDSNELQDAEKLHVQFLYLPLLLGNRYIQPLKPVWRMFLLYLM